MLFVNLFKYDKLRSVDRKKYRKPSKRSLDQASLTVGEIVNYYCTFLT